MIPAMETFDFYANDRDRLHELQVFDQQAIRLLFGKIFQFVTTFDPTYLPLKAQLREVNADKEVIVAIAQQAGLQPSLLMGICSRSLQPDPQLQESLPQPHRPICWGLLPSDSRLKTAVQGEWQYPEMPLFHTCEIIIEYYNALKQATNLNGLPLLKAVIATCDAGPQKVLQAINSGINVNLCTTQQNYVRDVLNRAGWFQIHGWL